MTILWREEMSVGNEIIDNDHKYLISIINAFDSAVECKVHVNILLSYVTQLLDYSHVHFEREQKIQEEISFPYRDHHRQEHNHLIKRLTLIQKDLVAHTDTESYETDIPRFIQILRDWLLDHVLKEDMRMKEFLTDG